MKQTIRDNGLSQIIEIGLKGINRGTYILFVNGNRRPSKRNKILATLGAEDLMEDYLYFLIYC